SHDHRANSNERPYRKGLLVRVGPVDLYLRGRTRPGRRAPGTGARRPHSGWRNAGCRAGAALRTRAIVTNTHLLALLLGFLLDQPRVHPPGWPPPVRWLGRLTRLLEPPLRRLLPERAGGVLLLLLVAGSAGGAAWGLLTLAGLWHPLARLLVAVVLVYH